MKKVKINLILVFILLSFTTFAQITVVTANKGPAANGDGLYYSLPATVFKVEVELQRIESIPGPLAEYCENELGTDNYIKEKTVAYKAVDAKVMPLTIADEKAVYYMVFSEKTSKDDKPPMVMLTPLGTLKSVNLGVNENDNRNQETKNIEKTIIINEDAAGFNYDANFNKKQLIDTVVRKITIDTMTITRFLFKTDWVTKTGEERAEDAARQIKAIREQRMNLLTGYHEINFGSGVEYMDRKLQEMEKQYLELFQGKQKVSFEHYTFIVRPEKDVKQKQLLETETGDNLTYSMKPFAVEAVKPVEALLNNVIYYRTPVNAIVQIDFNGENLFKDVFPVDQLGTISGVSVYKAGVLFDSAKGVPVKIVKF